MADPFDRAWDFMKNEDEDPNTTGNIDPNRSSRLADFFSGLGGRIPRALRNPSESREPYQGIGRDPRLPRKTKFSDLNPSHKPHTPGFDEIMRQNPLTPEERRIHGSPPFNPSQEDYPDVIEAEPPANPWSMPNPMRDQQRREGGQHPDIGRGQDKPNPYDPKGREPRPYGPPPSDEEGRPMRRKPQGEHPEIDRKRGGPYQEPQRREGGQHPDMDRYSQTKPKLGEGLIGRSKKALDEEKAERAKEKKSSDGDKDE